MDQFIKKHKPPQSTLNETDNLNSPTTIKEFEVKFWSSPKRYFQAYMVLYKWRKTSLKKF